MKRITEFCYALARCADGRWLLLNRRYKPFRTGIDTFVDYDTCPGMRVTLSEADLRRLSNCTRTSGHRRLTHLPHYKQGDRMVWLYASPGQRMYRDLLARAISQDCKGAEEA